jgi:hypothetical protein
MSHLVNGVSVAVVLFLGAAFLLRRRSNPYAVAAIGVTLAPVPALFGWFRTTRAMVDRFHTISAAEPRTMASSTIRALTIVNDDVASAQTATAVVAGAVLLLALFVLWRKPAGPVESSSSRSRLVSATALVALVSSLLVYEIGVDAVLLPLAVVASQQGRADPNLPMTTEAAKALFMDATSQDAISTKVGEYMAATTLGALLVMALAVAGFVVALVTSAGTGFPRSSAVVGLVLALLLVAATARELTRHRAIAGELRIVEARARESETAGEPR